MPPDNGYITNYASSKIGNTINFQCDDDYIPSILMSSTCTFGGFWVPPPEDHNCTFVVGKLGISFVHDNDPVFPEGTVNLELSSEMKQFSFFHCPNDTIQYDCLIHSNTEDLQLTWTIYMPDERILKHTFNSLSFLMNIHYLDSNINTALTLYDNNSIGSELQITKQKNVELNGTIVECGIDDLDVDSVEIFVNTSGIRHNGKA